MMGAKTQEVPVLILRLTNKKTALPVMKPARLAWSTLAAGKIADKLVGPRGLLKFGRESGGFLGR